MSTPRGWVYVEPGHRLWSARQIAVSVFSKRTPEIRRKVRLGVYESSLLGKEPGKGRLGYADAEERKVGKTSKWYYTIVINKWEADSYERLGYLEPWAVDLFLHELAHVAEHVIHGTMSHSKGWKELAIRFGTSPERCGSKPKDWLLADLTRKAYNLDELRRKQYAGTRDS